MGGLYSDDEKRKVTPMAWVLHCGDCLDASGGLASLEDNGVDVVITDPPYSEHVHRGFGAERRNDGDRSRPALSFAHMTPELSGKLAVELCRITRRWIVIFCDELAFGMWVSALTRAGGQYVRGGVWTKTNSMPQISGDRPSNGMELLVISHAPRAKGRMHWNGGGRPAAYRGPAQEHSVPRIHPTQKPLWLMNRLIAEFTDPGETICDPFAGSATTMVAAVLRGRSAVGWELDPAMATCASTRLAGTSEQLSMFDGRSEEAP